MQLSTFIYLNSLPIDVSFEQFLNILSELNSLNVSLDDEISQTTLNTLVNDTDAHILYDYIDTLGNSIINLLIVLFNQLQLVYYKTRSRGSCIEEKYSYALEFWKSQCKEFICCVSLLKDSNYLKVVDTSELKVDTRVLQKILHLLMSDCTILEKSDQAMALEDLENIVDAASQIPTWSQNEHVIQGKSKKVFVLKSSTCAIISRYFNYSKESCLDCTIYLLGTTDSLYISNCSNVTIYVSACGIASVDQVHSCNIKGVFKQVWIQNSLKTCLSLYTKKESIISNCSHLIFSPIDFCWDGHGEDIEKLHIVPGENPGKWDSWISKCSKNISVIDPKDFSCITLPLNRHPDSKKACNLQLPQEYKHSLDKQESLLTSLRDFINVQSHLYPNFLQDVETSVSEWLKNSPLTEEYIKLSQEMP